MENSMTFREFLETRGEKRWIKGHLREGDGSCLMGHLRDYMLTYCQPEAEKFEMLTTVVEQLFPERITVEKGTVLGSVPCFNDHDATTWDQVLKVAEEFDRRVEEL